VKVIVDTSIWSLALRRKKNENFPEVKKLANLINDFKVVIPGAIRQEILSGIKSKNQFILLKDYLSAFPDYETSMNDYELAAEYFNLCRGKGIQGSNTDFLICAIAVNNRYQIFTNDQDFKIFKKHLPISLYK